MKIKQQIIDYSFLFALCNTLDCVFQYKYIDFLTKYNVYKLCVDALYSCDNVSTNSAIVFTHFLDRQVFLDLRNKYSNVYAVCSKRNVYIDCYQHIVLASDFKNVNTEQRELRLLHEVYTMTKDSGNATFVVSNKTYSYVDSIEKYRIIGHSNCMHLVLNMFVYQFLSRIMLTTFSNYKSAKKDIGRSLKKMHRIYKYIKYSKC